MGILHFKAETLDLLAHPSDGIAHGVTVLTVACIRVWDYRRNSASREFYRKAMEADFKAWARTFL